MHPLIAQALRPFAPPQSTVHISAQEREAVAKIAVGMTEAEAQEIDRQEAELWAKDDIDCRRGGANRLEIYP